MLGLIPSTACMRHRLQPTRLLCPWNFPGKNTGVGCFPRGSSWPRDGTCVSCISCTGRLILYQYTTCEASSIACVLSHDWLLTVLRQASLSMRFSGQEYWSGLSFFPPGDLPNPGTELTYPSLQTDSLSLSRQGSHPRIVYGSHPASLSRKVFITR